MSYIDILHKYLITDIRMSHAAAVDIQADYKLKQVLFIYNRGLSIAKINILGKLN